MHNFILNKEIFYYIIEEIFLKGEHILVDVYRTIKFVLDELKINLENFLIYLESYNIQPCPQMLAAIRQQHEHNNKHNINYIDNNGNECDDILQSSKEDDEDNSDEIDNAQPETVTEDGII
jgi:hypothetical protein